MRVLFLTVALVLVGCARGDDGPHRFAERGLSLQVPEGWSVSGFSETVFPRRLVAATYAVKRDDVEGDCGGLAAAQRLPSDGAYVVLIDYGGGVDAESRQRDFNQRLPLTFKDGQLVISSASACSTTPSASSSGAKPFRHTSHWETPLIHRLGPPRRRC